jgi:hypothetical protein
MIAAQTLNGWELFATLLELKAGRAGRPSGRFPERRLARGGGSRRAG